jgi:hypothetical protein
MGCPVNPRLISVSIATKSSLSTVPSSPDRCSKGRNLEFGPRVRIERYAGRQGLYRAAPWVKIGLATTSIASTLPVYSLSIRL